MNKETIVALLLFGVLAVAAVLGTLELINIGTFQ